VHQVYFWEVCISNLGRDANYSDRFFDIFVKSFRQFVSSYLDSATTFFFEVSNKNKLEAQTVMIIRKYEFLYFLILAMNTPIKPL